MATPRQSPAPLPCSPTPLAPPELASPPSHRPPAGYLSAGSSRSGWRGHPQRCCPWHRRPPGSGRTGCHPPRMHRTVGTGWAQRTPHCTDGAAPAPARPLPCRELTRQPRQKLFQGPKAESATPASRVLPPGAGLGAAPGTLHGSAAPRRAGGTGSGPCKEQLKELPGSPRCQAQNDPMGVPQSPGLEGCHGWERGMGQGQAGRQDPQHSLDPVAQPPVSPSLQTIPGTEVGMRHFRVNPTPPPRSPHGSAHPGVSSPPLPRG